MNEKTQETIRQLQEQLVIWRGVALQRGDDRNNLRDALEWYANEENDEHVRLGSGS